LSWTYDSTNLGTTTISERINTVRLLVGDTDTLDQQVQNEEINFGLTQNNNGLYATASWVARTISSQYARKVNTELSGALKADYSDLMSHYSTLADNLSYEGKKSGSVIGVLAGGIKISTVDSVRENTDRMPNSFRRDRFKNPPSYQKPEFE